MNSKTLTIGSSGALLAGIGLLISVILIAALIGDFRQFRLAWHNIRWGLVIWLALLAALDHALRYWRWEILLRYVSGVSFKRLRAIILFSAGSLLIYTPGRAGEIAKSVYARDFFGIPVSKSLPVLIAERLSDLLVMAALASLGLFLIGQAPRIIVVGLIAIVILVFILLRTSMLSRFIRWKAPAFIKKGKMGEFLGQAYSAQKILLRGKILIPNLTLGTASWITEVTIFFISLSACGAVAHPGLFMLSLAFFPLASLAGSVSFLPGGLGVTEGGLVALGVLIGGLSEGTVVLAALLTRAAISGIVILAGIVCLGLLHLIPYFKKPR